MTAQNARRGTERGQAIQTTIETTERRREAHRGHKRHITEMNETDFYYIGYKAGYEAQKTAGQSADEYKRAFDAGYSDAKDNREPDISEGRRKKDAI